MIYSDTDKVSCSVCNEILGGRVADQGEQLQSFNKEGKNKADRYITENILLFKEVGERYSKG